MLRGMAQSPIDLAGLTFGCMAVIARVSGRKGYWRCRCKCGREREVHKANLKRHPTGCARCYQRKGSAPREDRRAVTLNALYRSHVWTGNKHRRGFLARGEWERIVTKPCHYCGGVDVRVNHASVLRGNVESVVAVGVDRVDSTRGYAADNVVPCCRTCNIAKHDMTPGAFIAWVARVAYHVGVAK